MFNFVPLEMPNEIPALREQVREFLDKELSSRWRTEFGNDRYWSNTLGKIVLSEGADNFWRNLTSRSDT